VVVMAATVVAAAAVVAVVAAVAVVTAAAVAAARAGPMLARVLAVPSCMLALLPLHGLAIRHCTQKSNLRQHQ